MMVLLLIFWAFLIVVWVVMSPSIGRRSTSRARRNLDRGH